VFDVGTDDALGLYLVMELLTGEDLAARIAREKRLPAPVAVRIALQVARALAKAHEAGVVHRDLKPANIFLSEREDDEPWVKILDFGISKVIDASRAESKLAVTRAGMVVGTPQYMSPEQARGDSVDEKTDVWALGLVLYEMLAGRPAYPELATYEAFIIRLVSQPPDPLREVAPWVPASLAEVVHQALEHDAAKRPRCIDLTRRLNDPPLLPAPRLSALDGPDNGDTWAEPAPRLPALTPERSAPENSLTTGIEPHTEPTLPATQATLEAQANPLTRSGVRPAIEESPDDDGADDALEFFDRRVLGNVRSSSSGWRTGAERGPPPAGPDSAPVGMPAPGAGTTGTRGDTGDPRGAIEGRRFPLRWMALVFVALGVVAVVALALR
jgi:serine/threonine protein kinase